jgi:hypothetical protein
VINYYPGAETIVVLMKFSLLAIIVKPADLNVIGRTWFGLYWHTIRTSHSIKIIRGFGNTSIWLQGK